MIIKKQRPLKPRPPRPDVLVVEINERATYAENLSSMKNDTELIEVGTSVTKIQKSNAGSLILELDRKAREQGNQLRGLVEEKIREKARISCSRAPKC